MGYFFIAYSEPVGYKRPVPIMRGGKRFSFNPAKYRNYRAFIHDFALEKVSIIEGGVELRADFYLKRPQNMIWKTKPMPAVIHTKANDLDNFVKAIKDALEGIAYHNDGQVAAEDCHKWYCAGPGYGDTRPRAEIYLIPIDKFGKPTDPLDK